MRAIILLLVASAVLAGCQTSIEPILISPAEYDELALQATVIDVHIPEQEHILGTDYVISYQDTQQIMSVLPDKNKPVIVYCRSGSMSSQTAQFLTEQGYTEVYDLQGGRNEYIKQQEVQ